MPLLCAPYGSYNDTVAEIAARPLILWSVDTLDWETQNADSTVQNVMDNASDGQIILMHDIFKESVDAAEIFYSAAAAGGLSAGNSKRAGCCKGNYIGKRNRLWIVLIWCVPSSKPYRASTNGFLTF